MRNFKENVLVFFGLGVLTGSGIVLSFTEHAPGGLVLLMAAFGTSVSIFWEDIKNAFKNDE